MTLGFDPAPAGMTHSIECEATARTENPPRVGIFIECPLDGLFHIACDIILTSRAAVSEMVDNDDDNAWPLVAPKMTV